MHTHFLKSQAGNDKLKKVNAFIHPYKHMGAKGVCEKVNWLLIMT